MADSCPHQSFIVTPTRLVPQCRRFSRTHCLRGKYTRPITGCVTICMLSRGPCDGASCLHGCDVRYCTTPTALCVLCRRRRRGHLVLAHHTASPNTASTIATCAASQQPEATLAHLNIPHSINDRIGQELQVRRQVHVVDQRVALQQRLINMINRYDIKHAIRQEERDHRRQQYGGSDKRLSFAHDVLPEPELRQPLPEKSDLEVDLGALREHDDVHDDHDGDESVDGADDDPLYAHQSRRHARRPIQDDDDD